MDPSNNTETEDETIAFQKKRARRVSFADNEITSVHIFRRDDEDSDSPFESTRPVSPADGKSPENEVLGFFRDLAGNSDDEDLKESTPRGNAGRNGDDNDDEVEAVNVRKSFLKPIGSPSPGSSTAGSVASTDDEDEFHGPVSACFIQPGELSDSAASLENHDLTMDSTAFSLHYRSLACSDSGDLKTPTRFSVPFEEKTPSQASVPTTSGSFMELTKINRLSPHPSVLAGTSSVSKDSNDMSIVGENPRRYDYHRLSPSIEAMLVEGNKDLLAAPELDSTNSGLPKPSKASPTRQNNDGEQSPSLSAMDDAPKHEMFVSPSKLDKINIASKSPPINGITNTLLLYKGDNTVADASTNQIQSSNSTIKGIKEFVKDAAEPAKMKLDFDANMKSSPEVYNCLGVSTKHDLGYHYLNENQVKQINLKETAHVSNIDHNQVDENLIQRSTPLLFSGREPLVMVSPNSSRPTSVKTPPLKLLSSILLDRYERNGKTPLSLRDNISTLENPVTSFGTSSVRERIDRSKSRLSKYSLLSTPVNTKDNERKHIRDLNAHLERQLFIVTPRNVGQQNLIKMDAHGAQSLMNLGKLSQNADTVDSRKAGDPYHCITADISQDGKNPKLVKMAASPYMFHLTAKEINFDMENETVETTKDENVVFMHQRCSSPPLELLDQNSSPSLESQKSCFNKLKQIDQQNASACSGSGHSDECSTLATVAKHKDMLISANSESSSFEVADVTQFSKAMNRKNSPERQADKADVLSTYTEGIRQSPIQEKSVLLSAVPSDSLHHYSDDSNDNCNQMLQTQVADSPPNAFFAENDPGKKRKATELLREENTVDKIVRTDGTSNVHTNENMDLQIILQQSDDTSVREKLENQIWKNYNDVLTKFSGSTTHLLGPSADKLNLNMIGMLEDILVRLWRVKKFEILCAEIHSQKIIEPLSILRHRKVFETRMVLYSIAYGKAKLQLMHMKREILQDKVEQLRCGLQECQTLKSTCAPTSNTVASNDTPAKSPSLSSLIRSSEGKHQTMSLELETLVHKAKSLTKFLNNWCKLGDDQNSTDPITLVHGHLKKRMSCKLISRNLQVWEIENFEHKDACYEILLNYRGCVIQRVLVPTDSPTIVISNKLNDQTILKAFPNMDALAAFVFVLNPDTLKKCNGPRCLAQETQITSSLLCNLLEVIEEVQSARIEIKNLVQVKFYSRSVDQLELQLSFIDFNTGRQFKVVFDVTCLKRGVYPMEIVPSDMYEIEFGEQKSLSGSLEGDIRTAAERVTVGYSRITRLCRSMTQVVLTFASNT